MSNIEDDPFTVISNPEASDIEIVGAMAEVGRRLQRRDEYGGIGYIGIVGAEAAIHFSGISYTGEKPAVVRPNQPSNFPNYPA